MLRFRSRVLILLLALSPAATTQIDQNNPDSLRNLSLEQLSQIEVTTPSKAPVQAMETPAAIFVITGDDIRRSGATSIPEALELAPGVEVARIDSSHWSIGIRGFGTRLTRSVLVLIDGRTVNTTLFDGTYWEVQDTMLEDVERIEVIRGPGGTIWGPNAVNGVINVITKSSKDTQGLLASAQGGTVTQGLADVRYGGGDGKGFSYRFYAKGDTIGPEYHSDGHEFDDWRKAQGGFRMDWAKNPRDTFTLQGDLYDETDGESVGATGYTAPYSQTLNGNSYLSGGNIMARWDRDDGGGNSTHVQLYYDRTNRHELNLGELRNSIDLDFLKRDKLPWRQELSWGVEGRVDPIEGLYVVSGLAFIPPQRADYLLTGYVQDEIALIDKKLSLTVGTKLLRTNFYRPIGAQPTGRLLWNVTPKQVLWTGFTHALRTPSDAEENFYLLGLVEVLPNGTPYLARFNPNAAFAPEQLNSYEVGYRYLAGSRVFVDVASFYNRYHDLFSEDVAGPTFLEDNPPYPVEGAVPLHYLLPAEFGNGLYGYTKGVEIAPEVRPASFLRIRGSYSYLHMNLGRAPNSTDLGSAPGIVGSSPQHEVSAQVSVDFPKSFQADFDWRFVSALPGQSVSAYNTGDARVGWKFKKKFDLSLVGQNLFQRWHYEDGGDADGLVGIKRSVYLRLAWAR